MGKNALFDEKFKALSSLELWERNGLVIVNHGLILGLFSGKESANSKPDDVVCCGSKSTLGALGCMPTNIFIASDKNYYKRL